MSKGQPITAAQSPYGLPAHELFKTSLNKSLLNLTQSAFLQAEVELDDLWMSLLIKFILHLKLCVGG